MSQPQFPDYSHNYETTVLIPQQQQEAAQKAAQAAQEALEQAPPPPPPVYTPPVITTPQNGYKAFIYAHESGNNPGAINPTSGSCGLGQAWPCSKLPCSLADYACQDAWFTGYAISRYGSWQNAYYYWVAHQNW